ncbi:DUF401 family protein [Oscillibacter sp. MSJ-2]|uniref:DUF401 family protein n=1 Tax=Dysosmobacter acutus TaxID=2841504 RepID=A0ABS6FBG6_9FIRM|nr:DUF401 family protein [Dysosmobacter acutus]MBU5627617.1 DUF401 family protein [Dysosmobacter acutus]
MTAAYLGVVFLTIVLLLAFHRPLYQAILGGVVMTALLYRIPALAVLHRVLRVFTDRGSCSVLISLYLITYLQRMLERRSLIKQAQQDLNGLFHNRRVNVAGASMFIGLLPSAAAMILCGDIVKDATDGYLTPKEQAVTTSWFRHIPESSLPTYAGVLLICNLSGVALPRFLLAMLAPVCVLVLLGYLPYLRKLPKDPGSAPSSSRRLDALHLLQHLWPLLLILFLILACGLGVVEAVLISIAAMAILCRFSPRELLAMVSSAFEAKLLFSTFLVLVLKELIAYTGVLELLPDLLGNLPIPTYLIFVLLFFLGTIISGTSGIIALGTPLAFAAMDGGVPLVVLLMCICHAASQLSPTHVCLVVAADYFHISLGELIRKTVPLSLLFCLLMIGYYHLLLLL